MNQESPDPADTNGAHAGDAGLGPRELAALSAKLQQENRDLRIRLTAMEETLRSIEGSRSWKITSPLRTFELLRRGLLPLVRRAVHRLELLPTFNVRREQKGFFAYGSSPFLLLKWAGARCPTGWVRVCGRLESAVPQMYFFLCQSAFDRCYAADAAAEGDAGMGFEPRTRKMLRFDTDRETKHLVHLPHSTRALRLDPFGSEVAFDVANLRIEEIGSLQVLGALAKQHVLPFVKSPRALAQRAKKAWRLFREGGVGALRAKIFADQIHQGYDDWVKRYDTLTDHDREAIRARIDMLRARPKFSVVMPTWNTPERYLRAAIDSVAKQLYPDWELCIADDASTDPAVRRVLEEYAAKDRRIKVVFRKSNGHIAAATNSALELATGEYVALLDHDDELSEHALYMVAEEIDRHPKARMIFSDEDKISAYGMRFNPYFKSDFNPELLRAQNCVCHLGVYDRRLVAEVGGFREGFDGAQDWDLALRCADRLSSGEIRHIPHILYHWRVIEGSTAQSTSFKPYVLDAQRKAVREHLERKGIAYKDVEILTEIAQLRVHYRVPSPEPLVSIVIPTRNQVGFLKRCIETISERTLYRNFEFVVLDNGSDEPETLAYLAELKQRPRVTVVEDRGPFNFSRINNHAVKYAKGEILGFLNNDLEAIEPHWLGEMVSRVVRPEIGAVGARLWYPNKLLQHAGIVLGIGGVAGHNHKGIGKNDPGYFNRAILPQNLSAVTAACLLVRREVFDAVGGFDEVALSIAFNDVDLCLRIREAGYLNVYTPYAEFLHFESASRGYETTPEKFARFEREIECMKRRWGAALKFDPYYNPNLTLLSEDFQFGFPPRSEKPWREAARERCGDPIEDAARAARIG